MSDTKLDKDNTNNSCPECGNEEVHVDRSRGEVICAACGIVISDRIIDQGPEWRAFINCEA